MNIVELKNVSRVYRNGDHEQRVLDHVDLALGPGTYGISILLTLGVSLAVGLMVARKNRSIDMVAALKTEE